MCVQLYTYKINVYFKENNLVKARNITYTILQYNKCIK